MNLRRTAIEGIGDVSWGTRISYLPSSKEDFSVLAHYIAEGLTNNELCVWVYSSGTDSGEIHRHIERHHSNLCQFYEIGQLLLLSTEEWCNNDSIFDESKKYQWLELINQALEKGYEGLRAVIDATEVSESNFQSFFSYQKNTYELLQGFPYLSMCLYDKEKIDFSQYADIIDSHDYNILGENQGLKINKNHRLAEKDKALSFNIKTELFSTLSHELRTPLNVIMSALQLLRRMREEKNEKFNDKKYLEMMQKNCYRLLRLVNNLIDITRIDSDFFELNLKNCNIVEIVENITLLAASYIESKGINIQFDTNTEEKVIACDPEQIERVMLNLLSNAAKSTHEGGNIWVKLLDCGNKVKIIVKDNGTGIPDDKQRIIFEKFQQVNNSLIRQNEGSGIGLPLVKSLIEKHGGKVIFSSTVGRGSKFIIELPCKVIHKPKAYDNIFKTLDCVERTKLEFADIS